MWFLLITMVWSTPCVLEGVDFLHDFVDTVATQWHNDTVTFQFKWSGLSEELPHCYTLLDRLELEPRPRTQTFEDLVYVLDTFNHTFITRLLHWLRDLHDDPRSGFCERSIPFGWEMFVQTIGCWGKTEFPEETRRTIPHTPVIYAPTPPPPPPPPLERPVPRLFSDERIPMAWQHVTEDWNEITTLMGRFSRRLLQYNSSFGPVVDRHWERAQQKRHSPLTPTRLWHVREQGYFDAGDQCIDDPNFIYHTRLFSHEFIGFDREFVTGFAPTDSHIWYLELWPTTVNIVRHIWWFFVWIVRGIYPLFSDDPPPLILFTNDPLNCRPGFPFWPDGIYGCTYWVWVPPTETPFQQIGVDPNTIVCIDQPTFAEYIQDVIRFLTEPIAQKDLIWCLGVNIYIFLVVLIPIFIVLAMATVCALGIGCCCCCQRILDHIEGLRQDVVMMFRHQRRDITRNRLQLRN